MSKIRKTKKTQKTKKTKKSRNIKKSKSISSQHTSLKSSLDFTKSKSLTILSKSSDIKSTTSVGEFYNLIDTYDTINKNCINKVKEKVVDGIKLNKNIAKDICTCLFEKNKDLTIEELERKTKEKIHTPGSSCISILDKFVNNEKKKYGKKSTRTSRSELL
jgi:hypothetical protein